MKRDRQIDKWGKKKDNERGIERYIQYTQIERERIRERENEREK